MGRCRGNPRPKGTSIPGMAKNLRPSKTATIRDKDAAIRGAEFGNQREGHRDPGEDH